MHTINNDQQIGDITLRNDENHGTAYIGYLIGEREYWGEKGTNRS